jgi:glycosyltransferase involved in cell wall biosynthesis
MNIGINLLYLLPGEVGGTETYALSLLDELSRVDTCNDYYLFVNKESNNIEFPQTEHFHIVSVGIRASNRIARILYEQFLFPRELVKFKIDLLHSLGYISPLVGSNKLIVTIHDLNYHAIPESFTPLARLTQRILVFLSAKRVDKIITVSEFTMTELVKYLSIPQEKIHVTYEAGKSRVTNKENQINPFDGNSPYILAFSSLKPHKNISRLVKAFEKANEQCQNTWKLIIIGHLPQKMQVVCENLSNGRLRNANESSVITTGFLPDDEVALLMHQADIFTFPSLYEGFGLPLLEAMEAGIPVVCSDRGSLPEIGGEAVLLFDPLDINDMAEKLLRLMVDKQLREELSERGKLRARKFSWRKCAQETLEIYSELLNDSSVGKPRK